jgi:hypothetical protein
MDPMSTPERPTPEPVAEPRNPHDSTQLGGKSTEPSAEPAAEPRYTLAEVADLIERREYGPGIGEEGLAIARWLRSGGATREAGDSPGSPLRSGGAKLETGGTDGE